MICIADEEDRTKTKEENTMSKSLAFFGGLALAFLLSIVMANLFGGLFFPQCYYYQVVTPECQRLTYFSFGVQLFLIVGLWAFLRFYVIKKLNDD